MQNTSSQRRISSRIITVPNIISVLRLCLVPIFFILLFDGHDFPATFVYALAASTDWIDGQIARRTNTVSRVGQVLDPAVDRILLFSGVVGLLLIGRLPLWIIVLVLLRDGALLLSGGYLLKKYQARVDVIFLGKLATTLLYVGFAGLLLNFPLVSGLGATDAAWLPGFNSQICSWGIWCVYLGMALNIFTTAHYFIKGWSVLKKAKKDLQNDRG